MNLHILHDDQQRERNVTLGSSLHLETCYDGFRFYDIVPCSYNDRTRSTSLVLLGKTSDDDGDSSAVYPSVSCSIFVNTVTTRSDPVGCNSS